MYGAGHVWAGRANFYLHDHEICDSLPDEAFMDMLTQNCRLAGLPTHKQSANKSP